MDIVESTEVSEIEQIDLSKCLLKKKKHCYSTECADSSHEDEANTDCGELPDDDTQLDWVYLEEVPDYMKCNIICCSVFVAPQLLTCCGRSICKKCIESHLQRVAVLVDQKPSCPVCRREEFKLIENTALELSINQLKVQCPYQNSGCGWSGTLQNGKLHLKECDFFPIDCPNKCACKQIERYKLPRHMAECPLQSVSCPFEPIGCSAEKLILRRKTQSHSDNHLHHHLLLIAHSNVRISTECSSVLITLQSKWETSDKQTGESIPFQKEKLTSLKSMIASLKHCLHMVQQNIGLLKQEMTKEAIYLTEFKRNHEQAKSNITVCDVTVAQIQKLRTPIAKGISCPPLLFTINRFSERLANECKYMWLSPPFYTHCGGYKMCLSMSPSTVAGKRDDTVSFQMNVHFMTGEFDDHLQWPFPGAIITLMATCRHSSFCNKSIHLELDGEDTTHARSKHIDGSIGEGYGSAMSFHRKQQESFFIRDCLTVMVYRIQFLPS